MKEHVGFLFKLKSNGNLLKIAKRLVFTYKDFALCCCILLLSIELSWICFKVENCFWL